MHHEHAGFFLSWILNTHEWYKIEDWWDVTRSLLWITTNLITAFCYYAIPWEIYHWRKALPLKAVGIIGIGFILFILACGTHHIVDVIIMPTAPWWAIWSVNIPMAIVSFWTWFIIMNQRNNIITVLEALKGIFLDNKPTKPRLF